MLLRIWSTYALGLVLVVSTSGCAIVSNQCLTNEPCAETHSNGIECDVWVTAGNLFSLFSPLGSVDVPLLLHVEYERPPYSIHLRFHDPEREYQDVRVVSVDLRGPDGSTESIRLTEFRKERVEFQNDSLGRNATLHLSRLLESHECVVVDIVVTIQMLDGTERNVRIVQEMQPTSHHQFGSWYSWCAAV